VHSVGYLLGCVSSRSGSLFSDEQLQRFALAPTFADLEQLLIEFYSETKRILQAEQVRAFIWHKYDAHNLKIILREKITGKAQRSLLLPLGTIPVKVLLTILEGQKPELGVWHMVYGLPSDELLMAKAIDAFYYQQCLAAASEPGLKVLAMSLIDIANIKKGVAQEGEYLVGGSRPGSAWQVQPKEKDLEQFLDEWLFAQLSAYRYTTTGVMPIVLYFMVLELEMKNIKIQYLSVQKKYPELKKLVRKAYV
jgi:vacuolar-type H+-ATPase subunit C/Vma6